jgi:hypothetical protein
MASQTGSRRSSLAHSGARRLAVVLPGFSAARLRNPVFLVGFGSSGKSRLASVLADSPDLHHYPGEGNGDLWFPGQFPWITSTIKAPPIWCDPEAFLKAARTLRGDAGWSRTRALLGAYQFLSGAPRLLNDSGMLASLLPDLVEAFPDARFIHMRRNGVAGTYLTARAEWLTVMRDPLRFREHGCPINFPDILKSMARYRNWTLGRVEAAFMAAPARLVEVEYERWCENPRAILADVCRHLQVPVPEGHDSTATQENLNDMVIDQIPDEERGLILEELVDEDFPMSPTQ